MGGGIDHFRALTTPETHIEPGSLHATSRRHFLQLSAAGMAGAMMGVFSGEKAEAQDPSHPQWLQQLGKPVEKLGDLFIVTNDQVQQTQNGIGMRLLPVQRERCHGRVCIRKSDGSEVEMGQGGMITDRTGCLVLQAVEDTVRMRTVETHDPRFATEGIAPGFASFMTRQGPAKATYIINGNPVMDRQGLWIHLPADVQEAYLRNPTLQEQCDSAPIGAAKYVSLCVSDSGDLTIFPSNRLGKRAMMGSGVGRNDADQLNVCMPDNTISSGNWQRFAPETAELHDDASAAILKMGHHPHKASYGFKWQGDHGTGWLVVPDELGECTSKKEGSCVRRMFVICGKNQHVIPVTKSMDISQYIESAGK